MSTDNKNSLEKDLEFNDSNIFEDFNSDINLKDDVKNYKKEKDKSIIDYISILSSVFKYINLFLFLWLAILFSYLFIQKNDSISNSPVLDPICIIIAWNNSISTDYCSSISFLFKDYNSKLKSLEDKQFNSIVSIMQDLHTVSDFMSSRDVTFLLDKSSSRLKPTEIIEEFDNLKNEFEPIDKSKITCHNIEIRDTNILTAKCESFSTHWEKWLVNFDWEISSSSKNSSVSWTSISIASSFLNFIEKKSDRFTIIDKQKEFSFEDIVWENEWYTKKTRFYIKLKYNTGNLSL